MDNLGVTVFGVISFIVFFIIGFLRIEKKAEKKNTDYFKKVIANLNSSKLKLNVEPFDESLILLRDLHDLQNDAPLERHREEWEKTMKDVATFLEKHEK